MSDERFGGPSYGFTCNTCGATFGADITHVCPRRPETRLDALEARVRMLEIIIQGTTEASYIFAPASIMPLAPFVAGDRFYMGHMGRLTTDQPDPSAPVIGNAVNASEIMLTVVTP